MKREKKRTSKERGLKRVAKGIYRRGRVYWIAYTGLDGKVIRESSRSDKYRDAETLLIKRRHSIKDGKMPELKIIKNHSFSELAADYLKWAERQRAYKQKKLVVEQLKERFGPIPLRRFDARLLEAFQTERLQAGKKKLKSNEIVGNKPATINRHLAILKHMFTKAGEWELVEDESVKRVHKVKLLEEINSRLRYLTREECQLLIASCDKHLKPVVITALNSGMRKGEILTLKWENVDLRHGFILLDRTKNGERREIPINETMKDVLKGITRRLDVPYVFYDTNTGKPFNNLQRSFNTACKRAKIIDFRFHDLRHCFASHLVMAGIDITTVKELLGHKTLTMTLRYSHLAPSHKVKAVDILDRTLTSTSTSQLLHKKEGVASTMTMQPLEIAGGGNRIRTDE
jgi:integrase